MKFSFDGSSKSNTLSFATPLGGAFTSVITSSCTTRIGSFSFEKMNSTNLDVATLDQATQNKQNIKVAGMKRVSERSWRFKSVY
jgi:hypothetical protein